MKLVVHDASILIDLALSETVDAWFATGIETWTTDLIFPGEIDRPAQREALAAYVSASKLKLRKINEEELARLPPMRTKLGAGLSLSDLSVFMLAREFGPIAVLATGDRTLRLASDRENIKACGILGLFDFMVTHEAGGRVVLPHAVAVQKLRALMRHPECRLPKDKCEERLRAWSARR